MGRLRGRGAASRRHHDRRLPFTRAARSTDGAGVRPAAAVALTGPVARVRPVRSGWLARRCRRVFSAPYPRPLTRQEAAMQSTAIAIEQIPPLEHEEAMQLAQTELRRLIELIDRLTPEDFTRPTDCTGGDVAAVVGHLLGMLDSDTATTE